MSLIVRDVRYRYAGSTRPALDGIDLTVEPGQVLGIVGANEAGKSTLCLVAAGLAPATIGGRLEGSVEMDGLTTIHARPHELAQRCGILFQNPVTQLSGTASTVWEEIAFGPRNLGLPLEEVVARVDAAFAALGVAHLAERDPQRLSGGQAQLVALAGVLALRPRYLILDEPTSQLDPLGTRLVGEALDGLVAATGAGVLIVEHKTDLLARFASTVAVVAAGRVALTGSATAVLADERLETFGVEPPSRIRLERAARLAGVSLPAVS
ncbi:MAG: ABC transporter ATP-binding protein [Chloroflexi bacterium]|nr:ABC transporter ATP-binding protein [Chloroflexota bacterium]